MSINSALILSLFILFAQETSVPLANGQRDTGDYFLAKNEDGILIFNSVKPKKGFIEYQGTVTLETANLKEVLKFFDDYEKHPLWIYNCIYSKVKKTKGNSYLYQICHSPWPYKDRDLNLLTHTKTIDPNTVEVYFDSRPTVEPKNDKFVRIEEFTSKWTLEKKNNKIMVSVEASFNPKLKTGNLFLKSYAVKIPFETLKNLKKRYKIKK